MSATPAFLRLWLTDKTRNNLIKHVSKEDLPSFRLACHDFSVKAAPRLFRDLTINFRPNTFTKPVRIAALRSIGHYVRKVKFVMPHGPQTFLPPLLDPSTGEEVSFVYEPNCDVERMSAARSSSPQYGSWEMTDLLVKQYPPLFHAAANVPSFLRAFSALANLRHLVISCPGQESAQRYRRSIVDYALISLRIAIERNPLTSLRALSLTPIHPGALLYLSPTMGFGVRPNSQRRWRQITNLSIHMDSMPSSSCDTTDHFKLLHSYLHIFSGNLSRLTFHWLSQENLSKGPFPLTLGSEPMLSTSTSPAMACPRRCHLTLRPLKFAKLIYLHVEHIACDAPQISSFITAHRRSISEFNFEDTVLRTGTWEDALSPLTRMCGNDRWKDKGEEVMDVPVVLSPVGMEEGVMKNVMKQAQAAASAATAQLRSPALGTAMMDASVSRVGCVGGWERARAKSRGLLWGASAKFLRSGILNWL